MSLFPGNRGSPVNISGKRHPTAQMSTALRRKSEEGGEGMGRDGEERGGEGEGKGRGGEGRVR